MGYYSEIVMGYLRNRLIQAFVTLFSIITLGFVFIRLMPGGPVDYLVGEIMSNPARYGLSENPSMEAINRVMEQQMNLPPQGPIWEQYITYFVGMLQGDFGKSIIVEPGRSNLSLILEAAPWTIFLSSIGLVYGLVAGIVFGSMMAYYEGTKFDVGMTVSMLLSSSIPYYVFAIIMLYFFAFNLGWFPTGGRFGENVTMGFNLPFILSMLHHAVLPATSGLLLGFGGQALGVRANSIRLLGSDFIRVARLRGLSTYTISTRYLARNAILPMYTGIVIGLGGLLGGSVITEEIFSYDGMGLLMFEATVARDFPLLTTTLVFTTVLFILGTLIADFTYALIDPRAEQASME